MISADLGTTLEKAVADLVESGRYNSKSEVLREGVRLVQEREAKLAALDASIALGHAEMLAGGGTPLEDVAERLQRKYRSMALKS